MSLDLSDPGFFATEDALTELARLQREEPVYWNATDHAGGGFWVLTRYSDITAVYRSPRTYSSEHGIQLGQFKQPRASEQSRTSEQGRRAGRESSAATPAAGKMLVQADDARHRRVKSLLARQLAPAAIASWRAGVREHAESLVTRIHRGQPVDFASEVAGPIALRGLGDLLGVPESDHAQIADLADAAFSSTATPSETDMAASANAELFVYFAGLLASHRAHPGDDVLSRLMTAGDDDRLSDEEILYNTHLLLAGGYETTRQALTGVAAAFSEFPEQWDRLTADPSLIETAVEEVLRWAAPSLAVMRTARTKVEVRGTGIDIGQKVTLWNPIANRDETAFARAYELDIARAPNRHLSFGMGGHFCSGAWVARHELTALIEALLPRVHSMRRAGHPRRLHSTRTWGYEHFPIDLPAR